MHKKYAAMCSGYKALDTARQEASSYIVSNSSKFTLLLDDYYTPAFPCEREVHVSYFVNKTLPPESSPILNLFMDIFYARQYAESKDCNNRTGHFQSYTDGTRLKSH